MTGSMKTFTVTIGRDILKASAINTPCVFLIYHPDENGALRIDAQPVSHDGLMGVYFPGPMGGLDAQRMTADIIRQVKRRGFSGVLLDVPTNDDGGAFLARICPFLASQGLVHYVPVELADRAPQAKLIVPSAISGGSFSEMLRHFCSLYEPSRLCLELIRTRCDFPMPSADPDGKPLSAQEFDYLMSQSGGGYYSAELCCRYFTYMDSGTPHFVMYDDRTTAREKAAQAAAMGFFACFALYGEWGEDIRHIYM